MTTSEPKRQPGGGLRRSRRDRVLGGVCAGIARGIGVDPVIVRIAAVLMVFVSGGAAVVAYLVAWVLIPRATDEPQATGAAAPSEAPPSSAKEAWTAVGGELKSLAGHVRGPARPAPDGDGDGQPEASSRPSLQSVDAAMTALGDRLRAPEVREGTRRTLAGLSTAVETSVGELGNRARRSRPASESESPESPEPPPPPRPATRPDSPPGPPRQTAASGAPRSAVRNAARCAPHRLSDVAAGRSPCRRSAERRPRAARRARSAHRPGSGSRGSARSRRGPRPRA